MSIPSQSRPGPTGPRTPAGKEKSSQNATKHGLYSNRWQKYDREYINGVTQLCHELGAKDPGEVLFCGQMYQNLRERNQIEQYAETQKRKNMCEQKARKLEEPFLPGSAFHATPPGSPAGYRCRLTTSVPPVMLRKMKNEIEQRGLLPELDLPHLSLINRVQATVSSNGLIAYYEMYVEKAKSCEGEEARQDLKQRTTRDLLTLLDIEIGIADYLKELDETEKAEKFDLDVAMVLSDADHGRVTRRRADNSRESKRTMANLARYRTLKNGNRR